MLATHFARAIPFVRFISPRGISRCVPLTGDCSHTARRVTRTTRPPAPGPSARSPRLECGPRSRAARAQAAKARSSGPTAQSSTLSRSPVRKSPRRRGAQPQRHDRRIDRRRRAELVLHDHNAQSVVVGQHTEDQRALTRAQKLIIIVTPTASPVPSSVSEAIPTTTHRISRAQVKWESNKLQAKQYLWCRKLQ